MASILTRPSHRAQLSRHGHDLSRRITFTSSIGQLLPVLTDYLSPGDKVMLNERLFTRTQPLKTCAFVRINEHVEYFFVPLCHLDPYWNNAFFGINDFGNSNDVKDPTGSSYSKKPGTPAAANFASCLVSDFMKNLIISPSEPNSSVSVYAFSSSPEVGTVVQQNEYYKNYDEYYIPRLYNFFRLASMLGYSESLTNTDFLNASSSGAAVISQNNPRVNLYRFAAYQKIFSDYYRLSDWQDNDVYSYNFGWLNKADVSSVDTYFENFYYDNSTSNTGYFQLFKLRYRPLKKDYFTSVFPTPYFNPQTSVSAYGNGVQNPNYTVSNLQSYILSQYGVQLQIDSAVSSSSPFGSLDAAGVVLTSENKDISITSPISALPFNTIQQQRLAYAYERMLAITQRAGKHYDDQVLAHFGYKVPQGISNEVYFLGGHTSKLMIGEVVATAAGASGTGNNSSLGEIAGRGVGSSGNNRNITFTAPCHGLLMAIYSAVPEIDYKSMGIEYQNVLNNINQYPRPEFDNLGMQPLWQFESNLSYLSHLNTTVYLGWQYRYSAFKLAYDSVHGAFNYTLNDWTMSYTFGSAGWTNTPVYDFYCSPTLLDNIFALSFAPPVFKGDDDVAHDGILLGYSNDKGSSEGTAPTFSTHFDNSVVYERDPLLHTLDISYKKTSWMSTYGLPNL